MQKKYTKIQILNSIKYWENELKRLNENKNALLNAFVSTFGKDVVFGEKGFYKIKPTTQMMQTIHHIANDIVFESKLPDVEFIVEYHPTSRNIASYVYAYLPVNENGMIDENGAKREIVRQPTLYKGIKCRSPYIEVPWTTICCEMPFMFIASAVIHEMIHQYDVEFETEAEDCYNDKKSNISHDPHGKTFKDLMNKINNEYGTSIEIACNLDDMPKEYEAAVTNAKKNALDESSNAKKIVYNDKYLVIEQLGDDDAFIVHVS